MVNVFLFIGYSFFAIIAYRYLRTLKTQNQHVFENRAIFDVISTFQRDDNPKHRLTAAAWMAGSCLLSSSILFALYMLNGILTGETFDDANIHLFTHLLSITGALYALYAIKHVAHREGEAHGT